MTTRFFGQRIKRNEDPRLLTGQALFVDDVHLPRMAHVAFVRSPFAHARINSIDASALPRAPSRSQCSGSPSRWVRSGEAALALYWPAPRCSRVTTV